MTGYASTAPTKTADLSEWRIRSSQQDLTGFVPVQGTKKSSTGPEPVPDKNSLSRVVWSPQGPISPYAYYVYTMLRTTRVPFHIQGFGPNWANIWPQLHSEIQDPAYQVRISAPFFQPTPMEFRYSQTACSVVDVASAGRIRSGIKICTISTPKAQHRACTHDIIRMDAQS
jgi:hypothetical protein